MVVKNIFNRLSLILVASVSICASFAFIESKSLPGIQTLLEGKWKYQDEVSNWDIKKSNKSLIKNIVLEFKKDTLIFYKDNRIISRQRFTISADIATRKVFKISFDDSKTEWLCDFANGLLTYREVTQPTIVCPVTIYYFKKLDVKLKPVF